MQSTMDMPLANEAAWSDAKLDAKLEAQSAADEVGHTERFRRTQKLCAVFLFPLGIVTAVACRALFLRSRPEDSDGRASFEAFVSRFGREYASSDERDIRFAIFQANYHFVQQENAKGLPYWLDADANEFADMTSAEFRSGHLGLQPDTRRWGDLPALAAEAFNSTVGEDLPAAIDWTAMGAVTPPKNQGHCGSCWSFSTTGALEGAWKIASGKLVSLSEQQFVDCDTSNNACQGGLMDQAFTFAKENGICTEESYPYAAQAMTCKQSSCKVAIPAGAIQGYTDVVPNDEKALIAALSRGPVSVAIEADQLAFQLYSGGVLTKECGSKLDHGVLLVGFGEDNGVPYWKVKNSWGSSWGEGGFIRLQRGVAGAGQCGIHSMASLPVVKAAVDEFETLV